MERDQSRGTGLTGIVMGVIVSLPAWFLLFYWIFR